MRRISYIIVSLLLILSVQVWAGGAAEEAEPGKLTIVTTTGHLADMARNIAPNADVTEILGPGTDPHTYVPSTREVQMLQEADLTLWNGLELEIQFTDTLESLGDHALEVARQIPESRLLEFAGHDHDHGHDHDDDHGHDHDDDHGHDHDDDHGHDHDDDHGHDHDDDHGHDHDDDHGHDHDDDHGHDHDHDHGEHDPHVWYDIDLWITAVDIVTDRIVELDPENEAEYRDNAELYKEELREADEYAADRFATIPQDRRVLITSHDAFGYLADRYGLEARGVFGLSTEDEAGIAEIEELAAFIADRGVPTIFQEDIADDQAGIALQEAVSARGGSVVISDAVLYSDALGDSGETQTFIGAFRHNVDTIVEGLTR